MSLVEIAGDPRGSRWRRWDPHCHFPGTLRNDQFGETTVAEALDALAARDPKIAAVGVTDYFTTASYRRVLEAWRGGAGAGIEFLFPNVELRLAIPTTRGSAVNVHLLSDPLEVDELDAFVSLLEYSYADRVFRCTRDDLMRLGRAWKDPTPLDDDAALRAGVLQFKVNLSDLKKRFTESVWARKNCLVAVAVGQGDGTSGVRSDDGAFETLRREMERFAHVILNSSAQQIAFWLGRGPADVVELRQVYGGLKPCIHGSDAHRFESLGVPAGERFTWLNGDASFDTLRLACLAPESRCHIDRIPPASGEEPGRIRSLTVLPSDWFRPGTVQINPGLVAIIGARGSGKTALADLIAAAAGSREPFNNEPSFVRRVGPLLNGVVATVEWTQQTRTACDFAAEPDAEPLIARGVRYLSQQFVDRLCSARGVSDELVTEVERVIFDAWPVENRQGATSFGELLEIRLADARVRKRGESESVRRLGDAIIDERVLRRGLKQKLGELEELTKLLATLEGLLKELLGETAKGDADRLATITAVLEKRRQELQIAERRHTQLVALQTAVRGLDGGTFPQILSDLRSNHAAAALTDDQWDSFHPEFHGDVDGIIGEALEQATRDRRALAGASDVASTPSPLDDLGDEQLATRSVAGLTAERARLERLVGLDAVRTKKLAQINTQSSSTRSRIVKLQADVEKAAGAETRMKELVENRLSHYAAYFDALLEEEQQLGELYAPLSNVLAGAPAMEKLRFSVKRRVDIDQWARHGEALIDSRKGTAARGVGAIARLAEEELAEAWSSGDGATAAAAIKQFSDRHSQEFRDQSLVDRANREAYRAWESDLAAWLYAADHVFLKYSIEFGGLNIELLSPGSRGMVLLLLYLAVDQAETDPLIIDQPEENLDPESVYSELVRLFRAASERRQIIMVTHNANLVINADVDQVIYARCERVEMGRLPELQYVSGGLEDPDIRATVCEVLEGGAEAFRERARRLRLELDS